MKKQLSLGSFGSSPVNGLVGISLFSGCGGLDLGISRAAGDRIQMRAWVEKDADARQTLLDNQPGLAKRALFEDICEVSPKQIMEVAGVGPGDTFVVVGGPPCQAFSTAGLRRSIHEARGQVADHYFEMIRRLRPRFFVFENVRGLLSVAIKHRPYNERIAAEKKSPGEPGLPEEMRLGSVLRQVVLPKFQKLGYEVVYGLLNAADYGTAQVRHRLFFLGSRDRELGAGRYRKQTGLVMEPRDLVPATHHKHAPYPPLEPWRTLQDAAGHLAAEQPASVDAFTYSRERQAIWKKIPAGEYWVHVRDNPHLYPPDFLKYIMGGAFHSGGGKVGYWRRLSWERPCPTLPTQPQHLATGLCHPEFERPLSIPEYAALQDFPLDYRFAGAKASRYRQIGNAVPVRLAKAVGEAILAVAGEYRWYDEQAKPKARRAKRAVI